MPRADSEPAGSARPFAFLESLRPTERATLYCLALFALNAYLVRGLFVAEFTDNMQTNAGSFMAISRFILQHWPRLDWFPWWFNGEPFENSYTPMLHLVDAGVAWLAGWSTARAYNFVTAVFYAAGPVFLFLFTWRVSRFLETGFFAGLLYSLFSPAVLFSMFRADVGGLWNLFRLRVLVYWGEGPHTASLSTLMLALLLMHLAVTRRKFVWCVAAAALMAFVALVNAFGAVDLVIGAACLIFAKRKKEILPAALLLGGLGVLAYLWASPFLTPTLLETIWRNSKVVPGDFGPVKPWAQGLLIPGFALMWWLTRRVGDYFTRFSLMFASMFFAIVALFTLGHAAAMLQPHRYSLELELATAPLAALAIRWLALRSGSTFRIGLVLVIAGLAVSQLVHLGRYSRDLTRPIDVSGTIEYRVARWLDQNLGGLRAFVSSQAGTWLNAFVDTPQMSSGHIPFTPNVIGEHAGYAIYSGQNAGARDAEISILWLKAYGCHAIYVPGPRSRSNAKVFNHPEKFEGVLPVLWHEEDDTIYAVPQRIRSLAHVIPEDAVVKREPINGLDVEEVSRYVAALDDASLPAAGMTWVSPTEGRITTELHPGQVLSVQSTYDKGWRATANGRPAAVTRDGIGLTVIHAGCEGPCQVDFTFDGGTERKICRILSWMVTALALAGALVALRMRRLY